MHVNKNSLVWVWVSLMVVVGIAVCWLPSLPSPSFSRVGGHNVAPIDAHIEPSTPSVLRQLAVVADSVPHLVAAVNAATGRRIPGVRIGGDGRNYVTDALGLALVQARQDALVVCECEGFERSEARLGSLARMADCVTISMAPSVASIKVLRSMRAVGGAQVVGLVSGGDAWGIRTLAVTDVSGRAEVPVGVPIYCYEGLDCSAIVEARADVAENVIELRDGFARTVEFLSTVSRMSVRGSIRLGIMQHWLNVGPCAHVVPRYWLHAQPASGTFRLDQARTDQGGQAWVFHDDRRASIAPDGVASATVWVSEVSVPVATIVDALSRRPVAGAVVRLMQKPRGVLRWPQPSGSYPISDEHGRVHWSNGWLAEEVAQYECRLAVSAEGYDQSFIDDPFVALGDSNALIALSPADAITVRCLRNGLPYEGVCCIRDASEGVTLHAGATDAAGEMLVRVSGDDLVLRCGGSYWRGAIRPPVTDVVLDDAGGIMVRAVPGAVGGVVAVRDNGRYLYPRLQSAGSVLFDGVPAGKYRIETPDAVEQLVACARVVNCNIEVVAGQVAVVDWDSSWEPQGATSGTVNQEVPRGEVWYAVPAFFRDGDNVPIGSIEGKRCLVRPDGSYDLEPLSGRPTGVLIMREGADGLDWIVGHGQDLTSVKLHYGSVTIMPSTEWAGARVWLYGSARLRRDSMCGSASWVVGDLPIAIQCVPMSVDRVIVRMDGRSMELRRPLGVRDWVVNWQ